MIRQEKYCRYNRLPLAPGQKLLQHKNEAETGGVGRHCGPVQRYPRTGPNRKDITPSTLPKHSPHTTRGISSDTPPKGYLQPPTYYPETRLSIAHEDLTHGTNPRGAPRSRLWLNPLKWRTPPTAQREPWVASGQTAVLTFLCSMDVVCWFV
jgi:hypothetical protein